jgi:hypothetical protein
VCFEKRLVIAHELKENEAEAYGELGDIHRLMANYEQAVNCMQHRITLARYVRYIRLFTSSFKETISRISW